MSCVEERAEQAMKFWAGQQEHGRCAATGPAAAAPLFAQLWSFSRVAGNNNRDSAGWLKRQAQGSVRPADSSQRMPGNNRPHAPSNGVLDAGLRHKAWPKIGALGFKVGMGR
jgi:hypothetical protein